MSADPIGADRAGGGPPPTCREVAAALDVDGRKLMTFVGALPDPTAPAVLGWAGAPAHHEELVVAWLDATDGEPFEGQGGPA